MAETQRPKVLCVDQERDVLAGLQRVLDQRYQVLCATNGAEALQMVEQHTDLAAIVADLRLADMDGASFLARARSLVPNAGRVLVTTGQTNLQSAITAVNEAQVLKFLSKPFLSNEL